jgi:hypothetical protein
MDTGFRAKVKVHHHRLLYQLERGRGSLRQAFFDGVYQGWVLESRSYSFLVIQLLVYYTKAPG